GAAAHRVAGAGGRPLRGGDGDRRGPAARSDGSRDPRHGAHRGTLLPLQPLRRRDGGHHPRGSFVLRATRGPDRKPRVPAPRLWLPDAASPRHLLNHHAPYPAICPAYAASWPTARKPRCPSTSWHLGEDASLVDRVVAD